MSFAPCGFTDFVERDDVQEGMVGRLEKGQRTADRKEVVRVARESDPERVDGIEVLGERAVADVDPIGAAVCVDVVHQHVLRTGR